MTSPKHAWLTPESLPPTNVCRRLSIPDTLLFRAAVNGALLELSKAENWEQFGAVTPEEAAAAALEMLYEFDEKNGYCMIGSIVPVITAHTPENMLLCDGSTYLSADYPDLAGIIDSALLVGFDSFRVPDLRQRFVFGAGDSYATNVVGGEEDVTLAASQMPSHTHTQNSHAHTSPGHNHSQAPHSHLYSYPSIGIDLEGAGVPDVTAVGNPGLPQSTGQGSSPIGFTAVTINQSTATNQNAGGDEAHENMPPYYVLRYAVVAK